MTQKWMLLLALIIIISLNAASAEENIADDKNGLEDFSSLPEEKEAEYGEKCYNITTSCSLKTPIALEVSNVVPAPGTLGVPLDALLRVSFNQNMEWGTGWIRVRDIDRRDDVEITSHIHNNELYLIPITHLKPGTNYLIILHTNSITSLDGQALSLYQNDFRTRSSIPIVERIVPADGTLGVSVMANIRIIFNQNLKIGTGWIRIRDMEQNKDLNITVNISGDDLYLTPNVNLRPGTNYRIIIHTGSLTSIAGHQVSLWTSNFRTRSSIPLVESVVPADGTLGVPLDAGIRIFFNQPLKMGSGWIRLHSMGQGDVDLNISIKGNELRLIPLSNLSPGTNYRIIIHTGSLTSIAGHQVSLWTSNFRTRKTTIPTISSAIYLRAENMDKVDLVQFRQAGITDIFLHFAAFDNPIYQNNLNKFLKNCQNQGIRVSVWVVVFRVGGEWINPTLNENQGYIQDLLGKIRSYTQIPGVGGINLDYVRFPGNAYRFNGGTAAITNFVAQVNQIVKKENPNALLSAALMGEGRYNAYYYGQSYSQLASHLDVLVPMLYRASYQQTVLWIKNVSSYIVNQSRGTPVWAALLSYYDESKLEPLPTHILMNDINAALNGGVSGYALFRFEFIDESFYAAASNLT